MEVDYCLVGGGVTGSDVRRGRQRHMGLRCLHVRTHEAFLTRVFLVVYVEEVCWTLLWCLFSI